MSFEFRISEITASVDGSEMQDMIEFSITPTGDQDSVVPIKDYSGKTIGYSIKDDTDCEGSITLQANSSSAQKLASLAESKKPVSLGINSKGGAVAFNSIKSKNVVFFYPEFNPSSEEANVEFTFRGTNFKTNF